MKRGQTSAGGRYDKFQLDTGHVQQEPLSEPDVHVPDGTRRLACFWSFSAQCSKSWKFNIAEANKNSDAAETWWAPLLPDVLATASEASPPVHLLSCCSFRGWCYSIGNVQKCNIPLFTHSQDHLVLSYIASNMATLNKTKLVFHHITT